MILVTGGTGFIGSYLIRKLIEAGKIVRATHRPGSRKDLLGDLASQVEWIEADLLDLPALEDAFQDVTEVYHCAAMVSFHPKDSELMRRVNVDGTANMVNIALDKDIRKFLYVSSIAALSRSAHRSHIDETSGWEHSKLNSNYAITKFQGECEVWRGIEEGLNAVIVNPAVVIGSGFWEIGTCEFFPKVDKGLKFFPVGATSFVDVRDVVEIMVELMKSEILSERFILAGENLSYKEFLSLIARNLDKPAPSIRVGKFLSNVAWRVEAVKSFITGTTPMVTRETALTSAHTFIYDASKVERALDYQFTPLKETIQMAARQYKQAIESGKDFSFM